MGNVNEPHVDLQGQSPAVPASQERDYGQRKLVSTKAAEAETPLIGLPPGSNSVDDPKRVSRPASRVLIHESESSDLWVPLSNPHDSGSTSDGEVETEPANTSFPLSDSELPETFDTCNDIPALSSHPHSAETPSFHDSVPTSPSLVPASPKMSLNLKDLCEYFASLDPPHSGQKSELPILSAQLERAPFSQLGENRFAVISHLTNPQRAPLVDLSLDGHFSGTSTPSTPDDTVKGAATRENASLGERDIVEALAEQIVKLESVPLLFSSPVPHPQDVSEQRSMHRGTPLCSFPRNIEASPKVDLSFPKDFQLSSPSEAKKQGSLPCDPISSLSQDATSIAPVVTYADATNLAMQYPQLASHFLTCPLPRPVLNVPASPLKPPQTVAKLTTARAAITSPAKPHSKEAPNWALAPDFDEIGTIQAQTSQRDFSGKNSHRGDPPSRPYTRIRDSELRAAAPEPRRPVRGGRIRQGENTEESGRLESVRYRDVAPSRRPSPIQADVSQAVNGYHDADVTTTQIELVENPAVNPTGLAIDHDSGKEWDLLFSDPWAEHLNSAQPGPPLPQGCENTVPCQDQHRASNDSSQQFKGGAGLYRKQQAKTVGMAALKHLGDPAMEKMSMLNAVDDNQQAVPHPDRLPFRDIPSRANNVDISQKYSRDQKQDLAGLRHLSSIPSWASNFAPSASRDLSFYSGIRNEWLGNHQHGEDDWLPAVPARMSTSQSQASHYTSGANMSSLLQTRTGISELDPKHSAVQSGLDYCISAARFRDQNGFAITPSVHDKLLSTCEMTPQPGPRTSVKVSGYRRSLPLPSQFEAYQDACGRQYQPSTNQQPHRTTHHHGGRETRSPRRTINNEGVKYW